MVGVNNYYLLERIGDGDNDILFVIDVL